MKTFHLSGLSLPVMALTVLCHSPSNLMAASPSSPPPAQQSGSGSKIGGFFKGLFYGRSSSGRYMGETPGATSNSSGYSLDRPPQESTPASSSAPPVEPTAPAPLPPHENTTLPKEITKTPAPETKLPATKPAPKKTDTPPVTIKPSVDESLPSEAPKETPAPPTKPAPRNEPSVALNAPSPEPTKPAPETKVNPPAPTPGSGGLPVGSRTDKPGRVKSPYPPYNELDVSGLQSGSLAMDPTTQKVFRLP